MNHQKMLTNSEFKVISGIDSPLSGDMELFAMFTVEMNNGENLWDVIPLADTATPAEMRKATEVERILRERDAKIERESRIAAYAERVVEELPLFETIEEAELEGWDKFLALDVEMRGGRCTRRGGVKNNAGFENFVDSAQ